MNYDSLTHEFLNGGGAMNNALYPGGFLDPNHSVNGRVWLASGVIKSITVQSQASLLTSLIEVYDAMDANGRPIHFSSVAANPRYGIVDTAAIAKRSGYGDPSTTPPIAAGDLSYNVVGGGSPPGEITNPPQNGLRWRHEVRMEDSSAPIFTTRSFIFELNIRCSFGMAVRIIGPAPPALLPVDLSIVFATEITGAQRFKNAQVGNNAAIPV